jgi:hypothetical protein
MGRISQCNHGMLLIPSALWDKVLRKVEEIHHELEWEITTSIIFYCRQKLPVKQRLKHIVFECIGGL